MKDKKKLMIFLKAVGVFFIISLFSLFFININLVLILFLSFVLVEAYLIWKEKIGQELIIAFFISVFITTYFTYEYQFFNLMIGKINVLTLVCWTAGLVFLREVYERINIKRFKFLKICLLYFIFLLIIEYVGYNFLGIRLNSDYPGLFGFNLMHSPVFLRVFYFLAGPLYLLITDYLNVK